MINWLDGKDANGMYILEIQYDSGAKGYIKDKDQKKIAHYCSLLSDMPEVAGFLVYNPDGILGKAA
jgi:hypothetical protein